MFNIDTRSNKPIYEQIIHGIKRQIMQGVLLPGDKLPSVRQLALTLSINPNTVSKAYGELERERVIETLRGKGTFVCERREVERNHMKILEGENRLKEICVELICAGATQNEILKMVEVVIEQLKEGESK